MRLSSSNPVLACIGTMHPKSSIKYTQNPTVKQKLIIKITFDTLFTYIT